MYNALHSTTLTFNENQRQNEHCMRWRQRNCIYNRPEPSHLNAFYGIKYVQGRLSVCSMFVFVKVSHKILSNNSLSQRWMLMQMLAIHVECWTEYRLSWNDATQVRVKIYTADRFYIFSNLKEMPRWLCQIIVLYSVPFILTIYDYFVIIYWNRSFCQLDPSWSIACIVILPWLERFRVNIDFSIWQIRLIHSKIFQNLPWQDTHSVFCILHMAPNYFNTVRIVFRLIWKSTISNLSYVWIVTK